MATDKSTSDYEFASWTHDTLRIGLPASSTRYLRGTTGGSTVATIGYTSLGKQTGTRITLSTSVITLDMRAP